MFLYFYGNLKGMENNPSPKLQEYVRLAQKYYTFINIIPVLFDNDGNLINLPDSGGIMDQDYITMKIILVMKGMYVEYLNSKNKS